LVEIMRTMLLDNVGHWRERASEARQLAAQLHDPLTKEKILQIANDYDLMACRAQSRARFAVPAHCPEKTPRKSMADCSDGASPEIFDEESPHSGGDQ
jgi:hypothetical protein